MLCCLTSPCQAATKHKAEYEFSDSLWAHYPITRLSTVVASPPKEPRTIIKEIDTIKFQANQQERQEHEQMMKKTEGNLDKQENDPIEIKKKKIGSTTGYKYSTVTTKKTKVY